MMRLRLREVREAQGLSRARLAAKADVTSQTVYNLESGKTPTLETARKLADALGVTVDEIFPPESESDDEPKAVNFQ